MFSTTQGDVLIAGLNEAHRTEVSLDGVRIQGIAQEQVHGRFATVTIGPRGSNIDFGGTEIKTIQAKGALPAATLEPAFTCEGKFVPME